MADLQWLTTGRDYLAGTAPGHAMKTIGISPSRRSFLRNAVKNAPALVALGGTLGLASSVAVSSNPANYSPGYFNAQEWQLLTALVERLIPADAAGPGATEAGVAEFIDRQMDQPYGHGALWFMQAPFVPTAPEEFGYQLAQSPRDL